MTGRESEPAPDLRPAPWYRGRSGVIGAGVVLFLLFVAAVKTFSGGKPKDAAPAPTAAAAPAPTAPEPDVPAPAAPTPEAQPQVAAAPAPTAPADEKPAASQGAKAMAPAAVPPDAAPVVVAEKAPPADVSKAPAPKIAAEEPPAEDVPVADSPAEAPAKAVKPRKGGEAPPSIVSVTFKTEPEGARVASHTHAYGTTPQAVKLAAGTAYDLTFTKAGYAPLTKHYVAPTATKPQTVRVTLKKLPEPPKKALEARTPPPPAPARKGWFTR
jgi:hypothetical protein